MRKTNIFLSMLLLFAMVLSACASEETPAPTVDVPPLTTEPTDVATEMPTEAATAEGTATEPGVPVTGDVNPARVSNELEFDVVDQSGNMVGSVNDMILDLDNTTVAYVIVDANGRMVAVPWENLELQTGTGTGTGAGTGEATATQDAGAATATQDAGAGTATQDAGAATATQDAGVATATQDAGGTGVGVSGQNVFVLVTDPNALSNAPEFDPGMLPLMGEAAGDWDAAIRSYWQGSGTGTGTGQATEAPQGTAVPETTATTTDGTGGGNTTGTATADAGTGTGTGTGTSGVAALQGIALASDVLGTTITISAQSAGAGTGQATEAPTTEGTATQDAGAATATQSAGATGTTDTMSATVEDLIVDTESGDILYIVVNAMLDAGESLIPVPVSMFQWDGGMQALVLSVDSATLQSAPSFSGGQFPDTTMDGWNSEIDSFWQSNTGSGSGSGGAEATATP